MSVTQMHVKTQGGNAHHRNIETIEVELEPDLSDLLDAFVSERNDVSRSEAVAIALREWATDRELLPRKPASIVPVAKLNARNDG